MIEEYDNGEKSFSRIKKYAETDKLIKIKEVIKMKKFKIKYYFVQLFNTQYPRNTKIQFKLFKISLLWAHNKRT